MTSNNRTIALDIGTKTCGIATTDPMGITIQPVTTLRYAGIHKIQVVLNELLKLFIEYAPKTIVIGLPYNMDGSEGPQAGKVREFVGLLKKHLKKNNHTPDQYTWDFFDERCTSEEADAFLLQHDVSRQKRKDVMDKMAAVFILQRYLEESGTI